MVSPHHNRYANTGYSKTAPILKNAALNKTNDLKSLMVSNPSKIETILKDLHSCTQRQSINEARMARPPDCCIS